MWKLPKVRFFIVHLKLIRCLVLGTSKIEWFTRKGHQSILFRPLLLAVCISGNLEAGAWQWLWPCYRLLLYVRTVGRMGGRTPTFQQKPKILLFGIFGAIFLMTFTTECQRYENFLKSPVKTPGEDHHRDCSKVHRLILKPVVSSTLGVGSFWSLGNLLEITLDLRPQLRDRNGFLV